MENQEIQEIEVSNKKTIKISKKKFKRVIITIVILLILCGFFVVLLSGLNSSRSIKDNNMTVPYIFYEEDYSQGISDTREFLKTSYRAQIQTRKVKEVTSDIKNEIKIADGRIDNIVESTKYANISFIIPKSNFESFKNEIESLTKEKLYTETISDQNLLKEKQSIEEQSENADNYLSSLQNELSNLNTAHNQNINTYKNELANIQRKQNDNQKELIKIRAEIEKTKNEELLVSLRNQEYVLINKINTLSNNEKSIERSISNENLIYQRNKENLDNKISIANNQILNVEKQDDKFVENIETVNGYINVNWINHWNIAKIYLPIHPTLIIIILIIVLLYYFFFRRIEFI